MVLEAEAQMQLAIMSQAVMTHPEAPGRRQA